MAGIILACLLHIALHIFESLGWLHLPGLGDLAVIAAAVLPAFGATAHGLFSHGEFGRLAARSEGMAKKLRMIVRALNDPRPGGDPLSAAELETLAEQAIDVMSQELTDWRVIFRAKPLEPAL